MRDRGDVGLVLRQSRDTALLMLSLSLGIYPVPQLKGSQSAITTPKRIMTAFMKSEPFILYLVMFAVEKEEGPGR